MKSTEEKNKKSSLAGRRIVNLVYEGAPGKKVFVAGSFNNWQPDKELTDRNKTGFYQCQMRLFPGEYQYKFVVDGNWCLDAENPNFVPNDFGTLNSLLIVKGQ